MFISIGRSIVVATPIPSNHSYVTAIWLVINTGYTTLELVPLIIKVVAAINRLFQAAGQMRRVVLKRGYLFGMVVLVLSVVTIFLLYWTLLDQPRQDVSIA
jgi:hypothetical protein